MGNISNKTKKAEDIAMTAICFLIVLECVFIGLKLFGVIGWSWWLILVPVWLLASGGIRVAVNAIWLFSHCDGRDSQEKTLIDFLK